MKIFSAHQIKDLDNLTCQIQGITSYDLMERAAGKCYHYLLSEVVADQFVVFCGMGDNGGDGFAIARMLFEKAIKVTVVVVKYKESFSENANINFNRYKMMDAPYHTVSNNADISFIDQLIDANTVIIDAIFGAGLKGFFDPVTVSVVAKINDLRTKAKRIIAIDTPSGISFEPISANNDLTISSSQNSSNVVVQCDLVLTFQLPKLPLLYPENGVFFERLVILDIGLEVEAFEKSLPCISESLDNWCYFDSQNSFPLPMRKRIAHKGNCGNVLLVAGSIGKMGAAVLATRAMLSSGVGLVTVHTPICGYQILQTAVPDAMVVVDKNEEVITHLHPKLEHYNVIAFGPGTGVASDTMDALKQLLKLVKADDDDDNAIRTKLVLDADAINLISENKKLLQHLPAQTILTPHLKELERLIGVPSAGVSHQIRLQKTREFCIMYGVVVVVKGANSAVVTDTGEIHFNSTGNQGLATAGAGDVLTGIITALIASGVSAATAAIWGCYIHGLAADIMANEMGYESITATKLIDYLGVAFKMSEEYRR